LCYRTTVLCFDEKMSGVGAELLLLIVLFICIAVLLVAMWLQSLEPPLTDQARRVSDKGRAKHASVVSTSVVSVNPERRFSRLAVHADLPRLSFSVNGRPLGEEDARKRVAVFLRWVMDETESDKHATERLIRECESVAHAGLLGDRLLPLLESIEATVFFLLLSLFFPSLILPQCRMMRVVTLVSGC
jgi:hypothetical protein